MTKRHKNSDKMTIFSKFFGQLKERKEIKHEKLTK